MAWILHDVFLARPPADCERRLKRRLANPATGCVACRERIYVFVTMLKVALRNVRLAPIVWQKYFWGDERNFLEPLMRFTRGDMRDHIDSSKIDHGPSWRRCIARRQQSRL